MIISIIVAMDINHGIGKDNRTPWHISSDLRRFKELTMGHYIILGRKTYDSIGRQLPGRKMIILSNRPDYEVQGGVVCNSIEAAIRFAEHQGESEVFIIGGGEIFNQSLHFADRMYLSIIDASVDADVFFPRFHIDEWNVLHSEVHSPGEGDQYSYTYQILERKQKTV